MNKSLIIPAAVMLILINSCFNTNKDSGRDKSSAYSKKALTGSFVDFFGKHEWTRQDWENQFAEMKELGMNTAIIQFTSFGDITWFNSANTFTGTKYPDALTNLLAAANNKQMEIHIGLYFDNGYWKNQTNVEWLRLHADRCVFIAREIHEQYGKDPAFKGWYIPHEPEPNAYHSRELTASFNENMINRISDVLHGLDSKPVSIAAFFNCELTSPEQLRDFMNELCKSNLQIIMLQDGVGVNHVSLDNVGLYYREADRGLFEDTGYKGEFWTDLETFSFAPQGPVTIERIKRQLQEEMSTPNISKAVSFQYYSNMSPSGPHGDTAAQLRNDYLEFIRSFK